MRSSSLILCLALTAFAPGIETAFALLILRGLLSEMDVPTRSSYVMAVVRPEERPAAASVTAVPRSLAAALAPLKPRLRGVPPTLPFQFDAETIRRGLNFTLTTDAGPLDCLGELAGLARYETVAPNAIEVQALGITCRFLDLDSLIAAKRAAGRRKDLEAIAELEVIREERERQQ